jgi:hypothetical protein
MQVEMDEIRHGDLHRFYLGNMGSARNYRGGKLRGVEEEAHYGTSSGARLLWSQAIIFATSRIRLHQ